MKRLMTLGLAIPAALAIAACGSGGSASNAAGSGHTSTSTSTSTTVSVRQLPGVGSVLVDNAGKALYANNLESASKILCNDAACNAFWMPLTVRAGLPTAPAGAGKLGVTKRPDGSLQVTANGHPLYTFSEDSPGKVNGNGFHDQFAGHKFTWNVIRAGGTVASGTGGSSGAGEPQSAGAASGTYGY